MLSTKMKLAIVALAGAAVVAIPAYYFARWYANRDVRQVAALRQQLLDGENLARTERNALKLKLTRTLDEMDRAKRRDVQRSMGRQQFERMLGAVEEYHSALSATERTAILDRELKTVQQLNEFGMGGLGNFMRGGGRGNRPPRAPDPAAPAADNDRGRANRDGQRRPEAAGQNPDRPRGNRGGGGAPPEMTTEQRTQFNAFLQAMRERAEQQGIDLGGRGGLRRR